MYCRFYFAAFAMLYFSPLMLCHSCCLLPMLLPFCRPPLIIAADDYDATPFFHYAAGFSSMPRFHFSRRLLVDA